MLEQVQGVLKVSSIFLFVYLSLSFPSGEVSDPVTLEPANPDSTHQKWSSLAEGKGAIYGAGW